MDMINGLGLGGFGGTDSEEVMTDSDRTTRTGRRRRRLLTIVEKEENQDSGNCFCSLRCRATLICLFR